MALKRLVVEFGMGTDLRGQDYTKAACRALKDALWHNSLSVCSALGYAPEDMQVKIDIAVAKPEQVDKAAVAAILPYGTAEVSVSKGGLDIVSADGKSHTVVANAAAVVFLDVDETST